MPPRVVWKTRFKPRLRDAAYLAILPRKKKIVILLAMAIKKSAEPSTEHNRSRLTELSGVLKALAHPSRLLIVETIGTLPHCVCELTELIGADTSTVSKHLSVLKSAGVVSDEKRGNMVYYSLPCPCVLEAVKKLTPIMELKLQHYSAALKKTRP